MKCTISYGIQYYFLTCCSLVGVVAFFCSLLVWLETMKTCRSLFHFTEFGKRPTSANAENTTQHWPKITDRFTSNYRAVLCCSHWNVLRMVNIFNESPRENKRKKMRASARANERKKDEKCFNVCKSGCLVGWLTDRLPGRLAARLTGFQSHKSQHQKRTEHHK